MHLLLPLQPWLTAPKPLPEALLTALKPVATALKPLLTALKPLVAPPKPLLTALRPLLTALKPVLTALEPACQAWFGVGWLAWLPDSNPAVVPIACRAGLAALTICFHDAWVIDVIEIILGVHLTSCFTCSHWQNGLANAAVKYATVRHKLLDAAEAHCCARMVWT